MTMPTRLNRSERPADASVLTSVVDIAGARHEVLPPRRCAAGGRFTRAASRAAPP